MLQKTHCNQALLILAGLMLSFSLYALERKDLFPVKGMCYSPTPTDYVKGKPIYHDTDFANDSFKALWGTDEDGIGRNDLKNLSEQLQVNLVRLYDWNPAPQRQHIGFLNTASQYGIKVIVPISNYFVDLVRDGDSQAEELISDIVSEVIVNGKIHSAVAMFAVGNEYDREPGFSGEHVAKAAEYVVKAQLQAGIPLQDIAFISAPVSFTVQGQNPPAIAALLAIKSAFTKNSYLNSNNIYSSKYIANVQAFNPGSDITNFLQNQFKGVFPNDYILFTELGRSLQEAGGTEDGQADFVKKQTLAALHSNNPNALGASIFSYINKNWKAGTEATFGLNKIALSNPPVYATNADGQYPVDTLTPKALLTAIQGVYSDPPQPDVVVSPSTPTTKQGVQTRASDNFFNIKLNMDPGSHAGQNAEWFLMHYGPAGLSVYDLEEGWINAEAPIVAHVDNLAALQNFEVTGKELQAGFHTFIFGVDLRVDDDLTDSKNWRVDIETLDVAPRSAGIDGGNDLDPAVLAAESSQLEQIYSELRSITTQVDTSVSNINQYLSGTYGLQAQMALTRFREATQLKIQSTYSISLDIHNASIPYSNQDDGETGVLDDVMNFSGGIDLGNDLAPRTFDFSIWAGLSSQLQGSVSQIENLINEERYTLAALAMVWGGKDSEAYQMMLSNSDATSFQLKDALRNLVTVYTNIVDLMQDTDAASAGMFQ